VDKVLHGHSSRAISFFEGFLSIACFHCIARARWIGGISLTKVTLMYKGTVTFKYMGYLASKHSLHRSAFSALEYFAI
jgi:hypothetical protein